MKIVGLTGSIGMGKSTVAQMFAALGAAVWDADKAVHELYQGPAVDPIGARFPDAIKNTTVDRTILSALVVDDEQAFQDLEAIIHPLVGQHRATFIENAAKAGVEVIVLDIPLLFETGAAKYFETIIVVSASFDVQRARVLARANMTEEKFRAILAKQMPDEEKRQQATYIVDTEQSIENTKADVAKIWEALTEESISAPQKNPPA